MREMTSTQSWSPAATLSTEVMFGPHCTRTETGSAARRLHKKTHAHSCTRTYPVAIFPKLKYKRLCCWSTHPSLNLLLLHMPPWLSCAGLNKQTELLSTHIRRSARPWQDAEFWVKLMHFSAKKTKLMTISPCYSRRLLMKTNSSPCLLTDVWRTHTGKSPDFKSGCWPQRGPITAHRRRDVAPSITVELQRLD